MSNEESPKSRTGSAKPKPPLALIAGPTASGKSDLAVKIALALREQQQEVVIINADSAQVYRDLRILSARPAPVEMYGIEHRLFGDWDGLVPCSAADWAKAAREQIAACHARKALPLLVGGTGLYIRTLLDGIAPVPTIDPQVRDEVRSLSIEEARAALAEEDPERAATLAPADRSRIARALEVIRSTGKPLSHWQTKLKGGIGKRVDVKAAVLLPDRDALYERCETRFARMLELGAIEEAEHLVSRGLDPALPIMRAIGVPEMAAFLRGELSLDDARSQAVQATRNYAKRQYTWFGRQLPREWPRYELKDFNFGDLHITILRDWGLT